MSTKGVMDCKKGCTLSLAAHHVSAQVDAEDGDSSQRKRNAGDDEEEEGRDLGDVAGQRVCDGLLQVVEDETTCQECRKDKGAFQARFVWMLLKRKYTMSHLHLEIHRKMPLSQREKLKDLYTQQKHGSGGA